MTGHFRAGMPALMLVITCALWGLSFPCIKALNLEQTGRMPGAGSEFLAAWLQCVRFGLAAVILWPWMAKRLRLTALEWRQGLILAGWGGAGMALQADGLAYTEASTSAFLTQAYCVFLPLLAALKSRQWPALRVVLATVLVLTGCAVLSGVRWDHLRMGRGELETLGAAWLFTFQILTLENPRYRGNRGLPVTWAMFIGIAVTLLPVTMVTAPDWQSWVHAGASWHAVVLLGVLAVFCSIGAFSLMNTWQPKVPATEAGLIYTMEPVFTAGYAMFLPAWLAAGSGIGYANEDLTTSLLLGGGLIIVANVLVQWRWPAQLPAGGPVA